jgi:carbon-monoxide dehydrogenase large subunit
MGSYMDDQRPPGLLHLAIVRSIQGHARIVDVDLSAARGCPGVVGAFAVDDLGEVGNAPATPFLAGVSVPTQPPLARERVRYVGEPVAAVVADTRYQAEDAARVIEVAYDPLPVAATMAAALAPDAPRIHDELPDNVAYRLERHGGDVDGAFARAAHVVRAEVRHNRVAGVPLETRGIVAVPTGAGDLTVWAGWQNPHELRGSLAIALGLPEHRIRAIVPDMGGAFGIKGALNREDILAARLALMLGRPVKWIGTRIEDFQATAHARHQHDEIEAALDDEGQVLAIRTRTTANMGAFILGRAVRPPLRVPGFATGAYKIPAQASEVVAVYTNLAPGGGYRGAGRPEVAFLIERLMDTAARELKIDPVELRRRNFIQPGDFPYTTPTGTSYDSGDYPRLLDKAVQAADYSAWLAERDERRAQGEIVGVGLATFIENTAAGWESGTVRVEPDGSVTALMGGTQMGQGITTALAQIVADRLGVEFEQVRVIGGDTTVVPTGVGSGGSRSTAVGGTALALASDRVIEKALAIAAHLLEAPLDDLEYRDGSVQVKGTPDRTMTLAALARASYPGVSATAPLPLEPGLAATAAFTASGESIASGAYLAFVSIDRDTGRVTVERIVAADDCGVIVNPMLAAGQVVGAIGQAIGEALLERVVYDDEGQILSSSLLDYALPTAHVVPTPTLTHTSTPSTRNPLGVKGTGEAGMLGTPPAIVNAVADALSPYGADDLHPPLYDELIWRKIQQTPVSVGAGKK